MRPSAVWLVFVRQFGSFACGAALEGTLRSVENMSQGWAIMPDATGLWVRKIVGTTILFR